MIMAIILTVFCFSIYMAYAEEEKYKSFAELRPELALKHNIGKLGETVIYKNGSQYHIIAECKHTDEESWVQWIDLAAKDKTLDGSCDFAALLEIVDGQLTFKPLNCMYALIIITRWCVENGIPVDDYIHSEKSKRNIKEQDIKDGKQTT